MVRDCINGLRDHADLTILAKLSCALVRARAVPLAASSVRHTRREMTEESTTSDLARLARQGYEAASRGDLDAVMSLYAADAVYDLSDLGLEIFEGAEAVRGFQEDWFRSWEEYRFEVEELLDFGHGVVLSVIREGGRLRSGSGRVEHRVAHLATFANGKIEWHKAYTAPDEARAAAERLAQERG